MKKNLYSAPIAEQTEVMVENRFLIDSNPAPASSVETASYVDNANWD